MARQSTGGIAAKAIAGIELALWDIRAKSLNIPVYALFGGPIRDKQQVYWSHCGTSRARSHELIPGAAPLHNFDDVRALGREVSEKGFTALKTNIVFPGDPGFGPLRRVRRRKRYHRPKYFARDAAAYGAIHRRSIPRRR